MCLAGREARRHEVRDWFLKVKTGPKYAILAHWLMCRCWSVSRVSHSGVKQAWGEVHFNTRIIVFEEIFAFKYFPMYFAPCLTPNS